ncbi:MAG: FAD binding domain-containing protein [Bacillota bacterium]|nr:FAD binding domain-containing protein [Bacillota bacterium]
MKHFEHINADSYEQASQLLQEAQGQAEAMAGGTDLLGTYKDELLPSYPETVVNLKSIPDSDYIRTEKENLVIGANAKLRNVAESPDVKSSLTALAEAAYSVASPLIRNTATVGGNLCQDIRCWYYRYPNSVGERITCRRKGGAACYAIVGENRYHSIFGGMPVCGSDGCQSACPAGTDIPAYMERLRAGDWQGAAEIFFQYNPMPMLTSRICPHLCKDSCSQRTYGDAVNIPAVERSLGDYVLEHKEAFYAPPTADSGKRCAVIGAGPGGLSAAFYLRQAGHQVTIYDAHEKPGGVMRYGIPHYRLPKSIVDGFCDALRDIMGVRFVMNTTVGRDMTVEEIKAQNDVVYFGTGAWSQPILGVDGENLTEFGLDFLVEVNTYLKKAIGEDVLVCGGGNVAMDVALTARRLGAKSVKLVCLEQREEMPASPEEVAMAEEEGVAIYNGWGLERILDEKGKVCGLEAKRCVSVRDENGRFAPAYDESDRMTFSSDFIILATGQKVDVSFLGEKLANQLKTARGLIDADIESGRTREEGFFAGGDAVTGPDLAIRAIRAGRSAAASMNSTLGVTEVKPVYKQAGFLKFDTTGAEQTEEKKLAELPVAERTLTKEDRLSYSEEEALQEAMRCMNCGCYAVSPSDLAPVLIMADAELVTTERTLKAEELLASELRAEDVLHEGELVKEIRLPRLVGESHYDKRRVRNAIDFATVSLASSFDIQQGVVKDVRLVLGAVAPIPVRLYHVEEFLIGKRLDKKVIDEAKQLARRDCHPMAKNEYKILMMLDVLDDALVRHCVS